ncbi:MAG TPA: efflux RND transporter periplasmic adaptor subunit [Rhodopila sp.]|nr:efflux RND transporter periplasmic adaptor subunit [Rhodopila sp.]
MSGHSALPRESHLPGAVAPAPLTRSRRRLGPALALLVILLLGGGGAFWWFSQPAAVAVAVRAYGSIDIRQSQLAFNDNDRIARILVQEGDAVKRGQLLAELDTTRLQASADKATADVDAARNTLLRLRNGTRPEEIAQARAALAAAQATEESDRLTYNRYANLVRTNAESLLNRDNAEQALKVATANRQTAEQTLALALEGPRWEDIKIAEAQLRAAEAALTLARQQLADARLYAPADGTIEDRVLEAGDMASPDRPVLTLDLTNPVYARAYLPEQQLGRVQPGMRAYIESDAFPGERFPAWVGFISTTAEFTPKTVETTEVRTELVYRMHVYACNPDGKLRLGAPVTVDIPLHDNVPGARGEQPCG